MATALFEVSESVRPADRLGLQATGLSASALSTGDILDFAKLPYRWFGPTLTRAGLIPHGGSPINGSEASDSRFLLLECDMLLQVANAG